jgi:hypothetical protein
VRKAPDNTAWSFEKLRNEYRTNEKSKCIARFSERKSCQVGDIAALIADPSFDVHSIWEYGKPEQQNCLLILNIRDG